MRQRLTNLRIPTGGNGRAFREILVVEGTIADITPCGESAEGPDTEIVDLGGALVLPGVIDGHVHFDDPGFTHRETFETGTRAAAAGGVTCIVDMPCTSLPPVISRSALRRKLEVVRPKAHVDFMLWGGVSGNAVEKAGWRGELVALVAAGVASIKIYMLSGMDTFRDLSSRAVEEVLVETKKLGIPTGVHAEDKALVLSLEGRLKEEGKKGPLDYAASRPASCEVSAVETLRDLCRKTGAPVHVVHVGSGSALDVIREARREGLPMTGETCPHYLEFTTQDLEEQGGKLKTAPVVKEASDRKSLWEGLKEGSLEFVATDHAPGVWPEEKATGSIWTDYGGVPGVELSLPYLYSEGVLKGRLDLQRLTEITAEAPARFFGISSRKGRIAPGFDADFAVLDEKATWTVRGENLHNLNRYTPLEGRNLTGRIARTVLRGKTVYARDLDGTETFGNAGVGQWIRRETEISE